jgi:hypothetical protein
MLQEVGGALRADYGALRDGAGTVPRVSRCRTSSTVCRELDGATCSGRRIVVGAPNVTGFNHDPGAGYPHQPTKCVLHRGFDIAERRSHQPRVAGMSLPTPSDPRSAPTWDNYVVAQAVQASLGLIPEHALAVGVEVDDTDVMLRFQLTAVTEADAQDIEDIVSQLEALVGPVVHVAKELDVRQEREISPHDGVRWIFLARTSSV